MRADALWPGPIAEDRLYQLIERVMQDGPILSALLPMAAGELGSFGARCPAGSQEACAGGKGGDGEGRRATEFYQWGLNSFGCAGNFEGYGREVEPRCGYLCA
jgi:hypothetical protein